MIIIKYNWSDQFMKENPHVKHPYSILKQCRDERSKLIIWNDNLLEWIANHVLGSIIFFDMAIIIPLLAIPAPDYIKAIVIILSSNWIQLWALFALQHTQKKADEAREVKADADHEAMTHIANQLDKLMETR
jgi:hypothetical protein